MCWSLAKNFWKHCWLWLTLIARFSYTAFIFFILSVVLMKICRICLSVTSIIALKTIKIEQKSSKQSQTISIRKTYRLLLLQVDAICLSHPLPTFSQYNWKHILSVEWLHKICMHLISMHWTPLCSQGYGLNSTEFSDELTEEAITMTYVVIAVQSRIITVISLVKVKVPLRTI